MFNRKYFETPKNSWTLDSNKDPMNAPRFEQIIEIEDEICTENQLVENSNSTKLEVYQEVIDQKQHQLDSELTFNIQPKEESKLGIPHKSKAKK